LKKIILPILALLSALSCAGARGYQDQGLPENLPVIGGSQSQPAVSAPAVRMPSTPPSELSAAMDRQAQAFDRLASSIDRLAAGKTGTGDRESGSVPAREKSSSIVPPAAGEPQMGKPEPGAFSRYGGQERAAPQVREEKREEKKTDAQFRDRARDDSGIEALKNRVSRLEELSETYHPGADAGSVSFKPADAYLSAEAKNWLDRKVDAWFDGKIEILAVNGYASAAKPADSRMTNVDYARQRAEAVLAYLKNRGVRTDSITVNIVGETARFNENKNVTLVWEEVKNASEQNKKKEERTQYKIR
jgi:outer membrane protein OmpA-like peptidoglycan-associated protein